MSNYRLVINLPDGNSEVEDVEATSAVEAAFLLGTNYGVTAALEGDVIMALGVEYLGVQKTAEHFMESTRENIDSIKVEAV